MKRPVKPDPTHARGRALAWLMAGAGVAMLAGCADRPLQPTINALEKMRAELALASVAASAPSAAPRPATPAPAPAAPRVEAPTEPRFDLIVNGAQARDVFLSMVTDTRYSMLLHPEVAGVLSVTLRAVTLREALESLRDAYGYDFKVDARRITVFPSTMQTRIFSANYLHTKRQGRSDVRVSAGSAPPNPSSGTGTPTSATPNTAQPPESSQVSTSSTADLWAETGEALRAMVGAEKGRHVIVSPQSGTIAVRAMPEELRQVEAYLRVSRLAVERQVMLEAKIVEVELSEGYQSGIDWSILRSRGVIGQTSGYPNNPLLGNSNGFPTLPPFISSLIPEGVSALPPGAGGTLGLALATNGFSAVLGFLEIHGDVQILSSPRVATLNNQKAVLKVGVDEYFVTNVSGGSITPGTLSIQGTATLPTLTLTPFFSGIALDVTPQIDEANTITLHIHPSVTAVTEKTKDIDLGAIGNYRLPLASSSVNETDTVVRVTDGNIVAIGGLMQMQSTRRNSGVPGTSDNVFMSALFRNQAERARKKELVVLIKPTIIRSVEDWPQASAAPDEVPGTARRVIALDALSSPPPALK